MVVNGEVHQHVTPLNGPSRKFIREGPSVSLELDSDDELVQMQEKIEAGGISTTFNPRFDKLGETYDIGCGWFRSYCGSVCGLRVHDSQGTGTGIVFTCGLTNRTSILLSWDMRDHNNRPVSIWQFTEFEVIENESDQHSFSNVPNAGVTLDLKSESAEVEHVEDEDVNWHLDWVPKGFELSGASNQELSMGRATRRTMSCTRTD